jgi:cell wall-associated NlpC family hydrolase
VGVDFLLDNGGRRLDHGLVAVAVGLVTLLAISVSLPVLVVAIVFGGVPGVPSATAALVPPVASPSLAGPVGQTRAGQREDTAPTDNPAAIDVARRYLGVRYVFGGTDPAVGLDCSGLVQLVFRQLGVALPRTAQLQYNATARLTQDQLRPGDLVFFARTYADPNDWVTHVGIYLGNGQQINAPTEGQVVSIQPVFSGFWGAHFVGGGRVTSR